MTEKPSESQALSSAFIDRSRLRLRGAIRMLPLLIIMPYLCMLLVLFLVWPIDWPIYHSKDWVRLITYVVGCYALLTAGYMFGTRPSGHVTKPLEHVHWFIIIGAIVGFALLFPISRIYTGRWPWEVLSVINDQGAAYRDLQQQLEETSGQRGLIALLRGILAPLTFAVVPLGLLHWTRLTWLQRGFLGLAIATTILLSLLRGTDREFADLAIVGMGSMLIALARSRRETSGVFILFIRRYWLVIGTGILFIMVASSLFAERKSERLGGLETRTAVCANTSNICADIDAPPIAWMPLQARFATSIFILSSASGFYGLGIAMDKDFKSSYGFGHSPAALAAYEILTGDEELKRRTFTYRNGFEGWSDLNYWSTLMTWIANDIGFPGVMGFMLFLGWIYGICWRSATIGNSDAAAVLFCALTITMFYLTANNQFFGSYDGYFVAAFWAIVWSREKRNAYMSGQSG